MKNTTKTFYLNGTTQGVKIGSDGFGSKRNCRGYLTSSSLSILNEKFFTMIFNEVVFNHCKSFDISAYGNGFFIDVAEFSRNAVSTHITLGITAHNSTYPENFEDIEDGFAVVEVEYKNGGKRADITPEKSQGSIKEFNYFGHKYQLAEFVILSNGKKEVKKWYFSSFSFRVL